MRNSLKVWVSLGLLTLLITGLMGAIGERHGLLWGFILSLSVIAFVYFFDELRLLRVFEARPLEGQDPWGLVGMSQRLAARLDLPAPRVFLIDAQVPTAFALGRSRRQGVVLISEPLAGQFSYDELEAVMAHLIARIHRMDTLPASAASAAANSLLALATVLDNTVFLQFLRPKRPCQLRPAIALFAPLIAVLIRIAVGRNSYLHADTLAADLTQKPEILAHTLWKLHSHSSTQMLGVPLANAHLFIVNPLTCCSWGRYFQLQPSVERRIKNLVGHYPI